MTQEAVQAKRAALESRVAKAHRLARLVVLAFCCSIGVYVVVGVVAAGQSRSVDQSLPVGFYAAAGFMALGSIVLHRAQFHNMRLEVVALRKGDEGLIKHFVTTTIIAATLGEAVGLLGLLATMLSGDPRHVIRFGIVGLVVALYNYPRRGAWQQAADYFAAAAAAEPAKY